MIKLLTSEEILAEFKVTPRTLRRWLAETDFPKPIRVGKGRRWYEQDIRAYLAAKKRGAA